MPMNACPGLLRPSGPPAAADHLALARLCAAAHRAGVYHTDFHRGNVLVGLDTLTPLVNQRAIAGIAPDRLAEDVVLAAAGVDAQPRQPGDVRRGMARPFVA